MLQAHGSQPSQPGCLGATGVSPVDSVPVVVDLVPAGVEKLSRGQAIFQKPADHVNHLKPLHVKGFINGKLVNNMLVDNEAMAILMPYSLYKTLGGSDEELIKTKDGQRCWRKFYFDQGICLDEDY